MAIQVGDIVGDYQVTGVLGRGGMGKVFRVRSLLTEREDAMKVVLADLDENPDFADRFLREIKVHASLQHPNIAALYTAQRIDDRLVMILELIEGVSLEEMLRPGGMDVAEAVRYVTQVLAALAFAHAHGVIHRDIKPANILIGPGGVVKLTDFGIARSGSTERLTGTGLAVGTLAYMSPEQMSAGEVDARSDIYSLGLMFYEMVAGRRAIEAKTDHSMMMAQMNTMPPAPVALNPGLPWDISDAIMRAIAKDPGDRFQTALDFQVALQTPQAAPPPAVSSSAGIPGSELADLEKRLARTIGPIAKRLVAEAARRYGTIAEIRQALASQIEDPREREAFSKTNPTVTATMLGNPSVGAFTPDPASVDRLSIALAPYIGPIAKVVVSRAARNVRSLDELESKVAAEIDNDADRRRFLAAVRS